MSNEPICDRATCVAEGDCGCAGGSIQPRLSDAIERVLRADGNPGMTQRAVQTLREVWVNRSSAVVTLDSGAGGAHKQDDPDAKGRR